MLKKINGKIIKFLAYLRKNYLSFTFKLSVFTTMLVLIYLVCALAHADSVRSADSGVAYPIESSEKLMLTIPPEVLLSSERTIEDLTALDNFISKSSDYAGGHPLFPIQKQTTTPVVPGETTTEGILETETTTISSLIEETEARVSAETETTTEPCFEEETTTEAALEAETTTTTSLEIEATTLPTIEAEVTTKPILHMEVTTKTTLEIETTPKDIVSNPVSTVPFKRSLSPNELKLWETTTDSPIEDTTHSSQSYTEEEQIETEQQSEQESKQESPEESKEETQEQPKELQEAEQEEILQELSNEALLTTTFMPYLGGIEQTSATTTTPSPDALKSDNLFMDNWPNYLDSIEDIRQIHPPLESSTPMSHIELQTENFFRHDEDEISTLVAPIPNEEPKTTTDSHEIKAIPQTIEHPFHSTELFKDSLEDKVIPPILSPNSLLNLFSFDHHVPAPSNKKAMWWAKPKNAPVPARAPRARSHKRHANSIRPAEASEEVNSSPNFFNKLPQFQHLDTLLNDKLQSSVSFFERLFGNFR